MGFLGSIFGGGSSSHAYDVAQPGQIGLDPETLAQQKQFIQALQQQSQGQGPSVANEQLKQALQQQQAGASALAAGARGVNPGLALRTAQQQQGQAGQAAAQSGAIGRAQEAMGAQGMLGNTLSGLQSSILGAEAQGQNANLKAQEITHQAGQQQNQQQGGILGGLVQGGLGLLGLSEGGMVKGYADGGSVGGPASSIGKMLTSGLMGAAGAGAGAADAGNPFGQSLGAIGTALGKKLRSPAAPAPENFDMSSPDYHVNLVTPYAPGGSSFSKGGKVPAMVSPGEIYVPASKTKTKEEAAHYAAHAAKSGKKIPGKAKVKGDSLENDSVPAELEEGGVVVPRTKAEDPEQAAAFVKAIIASQKKRKS